MAHTEEGRKGWVSEYRDGDKGKGVLTSFDGHTVEYDLANTEYEIEKNRAEAIKQFNEHIEQQGRGEAQFDFEERLEK